MLHNHREQLAGEADLTDHAEDFASLIGGNRTIDWQATFGMGIWPLSGVPSKPPASSAIL
jgi:hypothetical protein